MRGGKAYFFFQTRRKKEQKTKEQKRGYNKCEQGREGCLSLQRKFFCCSFCVLICLQNKKMTMSEITRNFYTAKKTSLAYNFFFFFFLFFGNKTACTFGKTPPPGIMA